MKKILISSLISTLIVFLLWLIVIWINPDYQLMDAVRFSIGFLLGIGLVNYFDNKWFNN